MLCTELVSYLFQCELSLYSAAPSRDDLDGRSVASNADEGRWQDVTWRVVIPIARSCFAPIKHFVQCRECVFSHNILPPSMCLGKTGLPIQQPQQRRQRPDNAMLPPNAQMRQGDTEEIRRAQVCAE